MITVAVVLLVAYLVGAIPWSWIAVRMRRGIDLRQVGSGNLGATNVYRTLGTTGALVVLGLDVLKGWLAPAAFAKLRLDAPSVDPEILPALAGIAAIAGHIFPVYLGFRGGKGIATTAGVWLALEPRALGIAFLAFLVGVLLTRGIVSVGSLLAALVLPIAVWLWGAHHGVVSVVHIALSAGLTALIWIKHAPNVRRLVRGEEKRLFKRSEAASVRAPSQAAAPAPSPARRSAP